MATISHCSASQRRRQQHEHLSHRGALTALIINPTRTARGWYGTGSIGALGSTTKRSKPSRTGSREGRREGSGFFWADSSFPKVKKFASASLGLLVNVGLKRYHYMAPSAQRSTSCKAALRRLTRPPRRPVIAPGCKRGLPRRMKRKKLNCRKSESNQSLDQSLTTCSLGEPNYGMLRVPRAAIDHTE